MNLLTLKIDLRFARKDQRFSNFKDVLHVDVWNNLPDEKLVEKLKKVSEVRDPKGLKQFVADALTSNRGQKQNVTKSMPQLDALEAAPVHKLVGSIEVAVASIPAAGLNKWWTLEKTDSKVGPPLLKN